MSNNLNLNAKVREVKTRSKDEKLIPGIVYGKDFEPISLWLNLVELEKIYNEAGESTIVKLSIENYKKDSELEVLIYDLQLNPINSKISHVDFYKIKRGEKLNAEVELEFIGESSAVKELAGTLIKGVDSIEIRCLPKDLPEEVVVDLSILKTFDDKIAVKDLALSDEIELIAPDKDTLVASVVAPRTQAEMETLNSEAESIDASQVVAEKGAEKEKEEEVPEKKKK